MLKPVAAASVAALLLGYALPSIADSASKKPVKLNSISTPASTSVEPTKPADSMASPLSAPAQPAGYTAPETLKAPESSAQTPKPTESLTTQSTPGTPSTDTPGRAAPGSTPSGTPTNPADVTPSTTPSTPDSSTPSTTPSTPDSSTPSTTPSTPDSSTPSTTPSTPDSTTIPTSPSTPATPDSTTPATPGSTTPPQSAPSGPESSTPSATPTATTKVLDSETITGVQQVTLPTPPVAPSKFTLPIQLEVVKEPSVTSDTPITDKMYKDLPNWASAVRACLQDRPAFVRVVEDEQVPFMVNGTEGKIRMNANNKPVCTASL